MIVRKQYQKFGKQTITFSYPCGEGSDFFLENKQKRCACGLLDPSRSGCITGPEKSFLFSHYYFYVYMRVLYLSYTD